MRWGRGGGLNFVCVLGALKNRCGMEYRTKGLINEPGWLALQRSWYLSEAQQNQLCDYMTTESARLAGIPGGNFACNHHACHCFLGSCDQALTVSSIWNLPLSWFLYERIRLNLINPRVLK